MSATSNMKTPESEVVHELVERIGQCVVNFPRQMRVQLSGARTAMTQVLLNDAEVHPGFQQMSGVRMSKGVDVRTFGDAREFQRALKCLLQTTIVDRTSVFMETVFQATTGRSWKQPSR